MFLEHPEPYTTVDEIAAAQKATSPYVSRVLRLTLLAPEIGALRC